MTIKLLALDLDGTTLKEDCTISERNIHAIKMAIEKGITVVPTTGRVLSEATELPDMIGNIPYIITSNGATIMDYKNKNLIYKNCISYTKTMQILDVLKDTDTFIQLYIDGVAYCDQEVMAHLSRYEPLQQYINLIKQTTIPIDNLYDYYKKLHTDAEKLYIAFGSAELQTKIKKELSTITDIGITSSKSNNIEINLKSATKATGLIQLCKLLNVSPSEVMAIGDNYNDLHMLEFAGLSVAVGNSIDEVKAIADYITHTNNDDGVAKAIEKFILNKACC